MSHSITEEMRFRQRLCEYAKKYRYQGGEKVPDKQTVCI